MSGSHSAPLCVIQASATNKQETESEQDAGGGGGGGGDVGVCLEG